MGVWNGVVLDTGLGDFFLGIAVLLRGLGRIEKAYFGGGGRWLFAP